MRTLSFFMICLQLGCVGAQAQDSAKAVFAIVERMPSFPGGENELVKFIHRNIRYPEHAKENKIVGDVYVSFIVKADGSIADLKVVSGLPDDTENELSNEALRVLSLMPAWKPGLQNNKAVDVLFNLPVRFSLPGKGINNKLDATKIYNKGNVEFRAGNYAAAIIFYDSTIARDHAYVDAYFNRAICYLHLEKEELACADFKRALSLGDKEASKMVDQHCK